LALGALRGGGGLCSYSPTSTMKPGPGTPRGPARRTAVRPKPDARAATGPVAPVPACASSPSLRASEGARVGGRDGLLGPHTRRPPQPHPTSIPDPTNPRPHAPHATPDPRGVCPLAVREAQVSPGGPPPPPSPPQSPRVCPAAHWNPAGPPMVFVCVCGIPDWLETAHRLRSGLRTADAPPQTPPNPKLELRFRA